MTKIPEQICITIENTSTIYVPGELLEKANDKIDDLRTKLAKAIVTIRNHEENKYTIPLVRGTLALDLDSELANGLELQCQEKSTLEATIHHEHRMRLRWAARHTILEDKIERLMTYMHGEIKRHLRALLPGNTETNVPWEQGCLSSFERTQAEWTHIKSQSYIEINQPSPGTAHPGDHYG